MIPAMNPGVVAASSALVDTARLFLFQPTTSDTTFTDKSAYGHTITLNSTSDTPTLSTAVSDPGSGSRKLMSRTGTNSGLIVETLDAPFDANGIWAFQGWGYRTTTSGNFTFMSGLTSGGTTRFYAQQLGGNFYVGDGINNQINAILAFADAVWVHYAVQQSGSNLRMFKDGTLIASTTSLLASNTISKLEIGFRSSEGGQAGPGYMTGVELVIGETLFPDDGSGFTPSFPLTG